MGPVKMLFKREASDPKYDLTYQTMRSRVVEHLNDKGVEFKSNWTFYYGGQTDLETKLTSFEVSYEPDKEKFKQYYE